MITNQRVQELLKQQEETSQLILNKIEADTKKLKQLAYKYNKL